MIWIYYVIFGRLFRYFSLLQKIIIYGKPYFRSHTPVSLLLKTLQVDRLLLQPLNYFIYVFKCVEGLKCMNLHTVIMYDVSGY